MNILKTQFFNGAECDKVFNYALKKREQLLTSGTEKYMVTTEKFDDYNFFSDNPEFIPKFVETVGEAYPELIWPIAVQAWCNLYENGYGINPHYHYGYPGYSYAANIFICGPTLPGITYFEPDSWETTIENKPGCMHVFPCNTWHAVPKNTSSEVRCTVGVTFHSYPAISPQILNGVALNTNPKIIILSHV